MTDTDDQVPDDQVPDDLVEYAPDEDTEPNMPGLPVDDPDPDEDEDDEEQGNG